MFQNRVMLPGIASLLEKDRAVIEDAMKSLVVKAVMTGGRSCAQEKPGRADSRCRSEGQMTVCLAAESREQISSQRRMLPNEGV